MIIVSAFGQIDRGVEEAHGLPVGIKAPLFYAMAADSSLYSLEESLQTGPVVMIFYRGLWCPYCNRHLKLIQDSLSMIYSKGASVIAVSPQNPGYLQKMAKKTGAEFTLLYDDGYAIEDAYDVTFLPEQRQIRKYNMALNANLKTSQSDDSQRLPIPATYLISQEGIIAWRQFDPNYKHRSTVAEILSAIDRLPEIN